jgi:LemA protein
VSGLVALVLVAGVIGIAVWLYNGLVRLRNQVGSAWAQVDVQLKRRHDLIPNLVAAVQGYMQHERDLFERIAAARTRALSATGAGAVGAAEGALTQAVGGLLAVIERYP